MPYIKLPSTPLTQDLSMERQ
ncbi:hypothetical protein ACHAW6_012819 [Cyclotella cf. meneghiniana]